MSAVPMQPRSVARRCTRAAAVAVLVASVATAPIATGVAEAAVTVDSGRQTGSSANAGIDTAWKAVLREAALAGHWTPYDAELLLVRKDAGGEDSAWFDVRNGGGGDLAIEPLERPMTVQANAAAVDADAGTVSVPAAGLVSPAYDFDALERKYRVTAMEGEPLLDRPTTVLEIRRRSDDRLRERLCVDVDTGLLLRRETFTAEGDTQALAMYVSLDVRDTGLVPVRRRATLRASRGVSAAEGDLRIAPWRLEALAEAGWTVPRELPGGYTVDATYALTAPDGHPLQLVYGDGLYRVSLFQQRGHAAWSSLPAGAEPTDVLGGVAYDWPGAVPRRLVWEAGGTTYSLVGDAPADEFLAIARSLPQPATLGVAERFTRGLRRLLDWMSPWG